MVIKTPRSKFSLYLPLVSPHRGHQGSSEAGLALWAPPALSATISKAAGLQTCATRIHRDRAWLRWELWRSQGRDTWGR